MRKSGRRRGSYYSHGRLSKSGNLRLVSVCSGCPVSHSGAAISFARELREIVVLGHKAQTKGKAS